MAEASDKGQGPFRLSWARIGDQVLLQSYLQVNFNLHIAQLVTPVRIERTWRVHQIESVLDKDKGSFSSPNNKPQYTMTVLEPLEKNEDDEDKVEKYEYELVELEFHGNDLTAQRLERDGFINAVNYCRGKLVLGPLPPLPY